jgi:primosomal protein N' (replication factor Y)
LGEIVTPSPSPQLTKEQLAAVTSVSNAMADGFATFLLAGVTGSGKTEVYIQLTRLALDSGLSVLVLVPEISLVSQIERRYRSRFGERVALLHSGLSLGERLDQWQRVMNRDAHIAIGARSAVFAPFGRIGLIIVDEEHDTSYKQEGALRYNARDLAVVRAQQNNCVVVLGSATPSIESYHNAVTGKYRQIQLARRVEARKLPAIAVVDLSVSRDKRGLHRFFSNELLLALKDAMHKNEQAIFFLNRRGFANFPLCAACGKPVQCKNCSITLTFHNRDNAYRCHYCGYSLPSVSKCSHCGSDRILQLGLGTEKVESWLKALYPEKHIARMDRDTVARKGAVIAILKGLRNREIDILVGTQMVSKGHDFPGITLVGIVCADLSLSFPDFRAGERTFQLLSQVAGRAGRGEAPGRVILQTYNPGHFSIQCARDQDFRAFYQKEIQFRRDLDYPPFSRMILVKISSRKKDEGQRFAAQLGKRARRIIASKPAFVKHVQFFGPLASPVAKIASYHRWQMLLKGMHPASLREFAQNLMFDPKLPRPDRSVKIAVDVDPFFML